MSRTQILSGGALAALLVGAAPAFAQEGSRIPDPIVLPGTETPAPSPAPSPTPSPAQSGGGLVAIPPGGGRDQGGTIGPDSLRDFSLGGSSSTPRPTPAPAPAPSPSAPQRSLPTPVPPPSATGGEAAPVVRPRPTGRVGTITPVAPPDAPPSNLSVDLEPTVDLAVPPAPDGLTAPAGTTHSWPWLIALLAMIGAGAYVLLRRRHSRLALADGQATPLQPLPEPPRPAPLPEPAKPVPVAAPPAAAPAGTVTTSFKPDLAIEVEPRRAVYDQDGLTLEYGLVIENRGRGAARQVSLRQDFLFASATQQDEYDEFLARPADNGDRPLVTVLAPESTLRLEAKAHLPIEKAKVVMLDGRALLLPILALAVRHRGQAPAQKPAAHGQWLIGRKGGSEGRMAPIRADKGPRVIRDVELRRQ